MPMLLSRKNARLGATGIAGLRVAIGAAAWVAPGAALAPWIGRKESSTVGAKLLARSLGSRDIGLGLGALLAMRHDAPVRGWIEAGALSDVGDTVATLLILGRIPTRLKWGVLATTLGAVAAGAVLSPCVDCHEPEADEEDL